MTDMQRIARKINEEIAAVQEEVWNAVDHSRHQLIRGKYEAYQQIQQFIEEISGAADAKDE